MATTTIGAPGVTFPDSTVQTSAGATGVNTMTVGTSPGTWTKPATVKSIKVTVVGGGGNGGTGVSGTPATVGYGGGGGGGGTAISYYPAASLPGPQPYTVGGATNPSSFGVAPVTVISATGGSNGASIPGGSNLGGAGGSGSGGQLNFKGSGGGLGYGGPTSTSLQSGFGGSSFMGGGAFGVVYPSVGNPAGGYGAGGSGGGSQAPSGGGPGAGSGGVVVIEEFY